jgi:hypothetical protein
MKSKRRNHLTVSAVALALLASVAHVSWRKATTPPTSGPASRRALTEQEQSLRNIAHRAVEHYEALYGGLPLEEWPEQPRATCSTAKKYLEELGTDGD